MCGVRCAVCGARCAVVGVGAAAWCVRAGVGAPSKSRARASSAVAAFLCVMPLTAVLPCLSSWIVSVGAASSLRLRRSKSASLCISRYDTRTVTMFCASMPSSCE